MKGFHNKIKATILLLLFSFFFVIVFPSTPKALEIMICHKQKDFYGLLYIIDPLRCFRGEKPEHIVYEKGLYEVYKEGWKLIQIIKDSSTGELDYYAYFEK